MTAKTLPPYITRMPTIFPLRAAVPSAPLGTILRVNERLACTESDQAGTMWVWARTQADADAASKAMPALVFAAL